MDDFTPLTRRASESASEWRLRLLDDMAARHRHGARIPVEAYLERLPGLAAETEVVLDLLAAEWTLRRQAGEAVALSEYLQRFPTREGDIRMLWQADELTPPPVGDNPSPLDPSRLPAWYTGNADFPVVFGEYRLLREFGGGGMARVFLAEPLAGGEVVALKAPKLPLGEDEQAVVDRTTRRLRFLREARLTSRLDHPRLCRVLEVGEKDGLPYFTMPYYPRGSVGEELQAHGRFAERDAARLIADVARALQHAHSLGILHRDLKPSNLLRDEQGNVVAVDFGLALPVDEEGPRLTSTGKILGTVLYLSPEQAHGRADLTPASDVFSLGVVLYELLAGKPPFAGNVVEVVMAIVEQPEPPLENVSPALAAICRKAMAKKPADRYPTMDAFADDLERFLADEWTPRPPKRIRWWVAAAGVAAMAVLASVAVRAIVASHEYPPSRSPGGNSHPQVERPVVSKREPIGFRGQLQFMHDDLDRLDATKRPHVRYFSLLAVHDNPYVSDADYNLHLDALGRVLNRFGSSERKVTVYPVDASGCLLRIDLRDLDWHPAQEWSLLLKAEPYGVRYDAVQPDESLQKLARETYALAGINSLFDAPCVRADWLIATATHAPLFDELQHTDGQGRRTPPFDRTDGNDPVARVVQLYQANAVDARVAAAELGLGTVAELDARWPADKRDMRTALDQPLSRNSWAGEDGRALFADYVRALRLGVPRAIQPLH